MFDKIPSLLYNSLYKGGVTMTLGDFIRQYRNENSLSMEDFAHKSGFSKSYVNLLEKNKHPIIKFFYL